MTDTLTISTTNSTLYSHGFSTSVFHLLTMYYIFILQWTTSKCQMHLLSARTLAFERTQKSDLETKGQKEVKPSSQLFKMEDSAKN